MLLDTHVMLWLRLGARELGAGARVDIDRAWQSGEGAVTAISFWEVAMLKAKGRIRFPRMSHGGAWSSWYRAWLRLRRW